MHKLPRGYSTDMKGIHKISATLNIRYRSYTNRGRVTDRPETCINMEVLATQYINKK